MNPPRDYDVVVVGSGVAGLATALGLAGVRRVALVTNGTLGGGSTAWAQGGLAAALADDDTAELHALDTMTAGAELGDAGAVRVLTDAAPSALAELLRRGARLDRDAFGRLELTREGGHTRRRVVHAGGDASGAEVRRALVAAVRASDVEGIEHATVRDVQTARFADRRIVTGVAIDVAGAQPRALSAPAVVLATGGVGGLFASTTNPPDVKGTGLGLALRAGASLVDVEFVQFHPTALDVEPATGRVPLITEALRGEGAVLRDGGGRPVMAGRHPLGDLAPRDVVARRVDEVRSAGEPVFLDATGVANVTDRFPTIVAACRAHGIDPTRQPIPVAPTQHFLCGGIRTDEWGATDVDGLYAVGEVAATGVHGANRLASNSLVEGLVFGGRVAARLALDLPPAAGRRAGRGAGPLTTEREPTRAPVGARGLPEIRRVLSCSAGIRRSGPALDTALAELVAIRDDPANRDETGAGGDEWLAAMAIVAAAATRRESRGCHWRSDHPVPSEWWRRHRVAVRLGADGLPSATTLPTAPETRPLERSA